MDAEKSSIVSQLVTSHERKVKSLYTLLSAWCRVLVELETRPDRSCNAAGATPILTPHLLIECRVGMSLS